MIRKTRFTKFDLAWLVDATALPSCDEIGIQRVPYALPPGLGEAWVEALELRDGSALYRAVHALDAAPSGQLIPLMTVDFVQPHVFFNAQIWLNGHGYHREYWHGPEQPPVEIVASPGRDTFRYIRNWRAEILAEGGVTSEMRSVVLPDPLLRTLIGEEMALGLLQSLGLDGKQLTSVRAMPTHVSTPLRQAMSGHVAGAARKLHAQAKLLEYLALLQATVTHVAPVTPQAREGQQLADDLYQRLIHAEGSLPTLSGLAEEYGVSARKLNAAFAAKYQKSIYAFVTEHRLQQAHEAIRLSGTPLKVLAAHLGYSHVNHFIVAFKRQFGYPPGSLRRSK